MIAIFPNCGLLHTAPGCFWLPRPVLTSRSSMYRHTHTVRPFLEVETPRNNGCCHHLVHQGSHVRFEVESTMEGGGNMG
eukprot:10162446-Alexandrium_andersonii.AAC.1